MAARAIYDAVRLMSLDQKGRLAMRVGYGRDKAKRTFYEVVQHEEGTVAGRWTCDGNIPFIVVGRRPEAESDAAMFPRRVSWKTIDDFEDHALRRVITGGNKWRPVCVCITTSSSADETVAWDEANDPDYEEDYVPSSDSEEEEEDSEDSEEENDSEEDPDEEDFNDDSDNEEVEDEDAEKDNGRKRMRLD